MSLSWVRIIKFGFRKIELLVGSLLPFLNISSKSLNIAIIKQFKLDDNSENDTDRIKSHATVSHQYFSEKACHGVHVSSLLGQGLLAYRKHKSYFAIVKIRNYPLNGPVTFARLMFIYETLVMAKITYKANLKTH